MEKVILFEGIMIRFGKSCESLLAHKNIFFEQNDGKLARFQGIASYYAAQPRRKRCKNCGFDISEIAFSKLGVDYLFCVQCGHLNGGNEDTSQFCEKIYTTEGGKEYGSTYASKDRKNFTQRMTDIYLPKAEFLIAALKEQAEEPERLTYSDLGAGSGYFVGALLAAGLINARGYEVSRSQVDLANAMLDGEYIVQHDVSAIENLAAEIDVDVISMIGVLEHIQNPFAVLENISRNKKIKYLYISVPLFSPCIFFEMVFPNVMPRQLVGGHTHLYTESSIDWFCKKFGFQRVSEWWFGTDFVDLYRSVLVSLQKKSELEKMADNWMKIFLPVIDNIQLEIDRKKLSSEVHMLLQLR